MSLPDQPISSVLWLARDTLHGNLYNPNHVAPPELKLLRQSILADGWTQPLVARRDGEIVDGFHRFTVSGDPAVAALTDGLLPVVYLRDGLSLEAQMAATIRHNRARGVHGVVPMAAIVRAMKERGIGDKELRAMLGMDQEEINRLYDFAGMPAATGQPAFGKGWVPT